MPTSNSSNICSSLTASIAGCSSVAGRHAALSTAACSSDHGAMQYGDALRVPHLHLQSSHRMREEHLFTPCSPLRRRASSCLFCILFRLYLQCSICFHVKRSHPRAALQSDGRAHAVLCCFGGRKGSPSVASSSFGDPAMPTCTHNPEKRVTTRLAIPGFSSPM